MNSMRGYGRNADTAHGEAECYISIMTTPMSAVIHVVTSINNGLLKCQMTVPVQSKFILHNWNFISYLMSHWNDNNKVVVQTEGKKELCSVQ